MQSNNFVSIRNPNRKNSRLFTTTNNTRLVNRAGFSLFEFILVIVILTTLFSILISKFTELQNDAHESSVRLSANSLRSAVNVIHAVWQAQGSKDEIVVLEGYEGGKVLVGRRGWPIDVAVVDVVSIDIGNVSHDSHIQNSAPPSANNLTCRRLWDGLLKDSTPKVESERDKKVTYLAEFHQGACRFRYLLTEDDFRIEYDLKTGQVNTFF